MEKGVEEITKRIAELGAELRYMQSTRADEQGLSPQALRQLISDKVEESLKLQRSLEKIR